MALVVLFGIAIYMIASALGVERSELLGYFVTSAMLVVWSILTALVLFGSIRLFRRR